MATNHYWWVDGWREDHELGSPYDPLLCSTSAKDFLSSKMESIPNNNGHPYYPRTAEIPGYVPNALPMPVLLGAVLIAMGTVVNASFCAARSKSKTLNESSRFTWFTLCTTLHCGFEAYWIYNHQSIASRTDFLAELWKEYAHGDSRYLFSDELLLALETITVVSIITMTLTFTYNAFFSLSVVHFALWQLMRYGSNHHSNIYGNYWHPWLICSAQCSTLWWIGEKAFQTVILIHYTFGFTLSPSIHPGWL